MKYLYILCMFIYSAVCASSAQPMLFKQGAARKSNLIPVIYRPDYRIGPAYAAHLLSLAHPFDVTKAEQVAAYLQRNNWQLYAPKDEVTHAQMYAVDIHTPEYLHILETKSAATVAAIFGSPIIAKFPDWSVDNYILAPMRKQVAGTLLAVALARKYGWAVNLGGGFHHAKPDGGEGFCVYGDIQFAVKQYLHDNPTGNVLIIDLDVHRGNGYAQALLHEPRVNIFDVYAAHHYPLHDRHLCKRIDFNFPLEVGTAFAIDDAVYLGLLKRELVRAVAAAKPDIIFYNVGTTIARGDSVGRIQLSHEGMLARDMLVFKIAYDQSIPIVMTISGEQSAGGHDSIAASLERIIALYASRNSTL